MGIIIAFVILGVIIVGIVSGGVAIYNRLVMLEVLPIRFPRGENGCKY